MTIFEYLSVFISIVIGLGVIHVLSGVARMVTDVGTRPYWIHVLWSLNLLYSLAFFWWFTFDWRLQTTWEFNLFLFVVVFAMLEYFLCVLIIPFDPPEDLNYKEYYYSKHRVIFALWAVIVLVDTADAILKGPDNLERLGAIYFPSQLGFFLLMGSIAVSRNERLHAAAVLVWTVTLFIPPFTSMYDVFGG